MIFLKWSRNFESEGKIVFWEQNGYLWGKVVDIYIEKCPFVPSFGEKRNKKGRMWGDRYENTAEYTGDGAGATYARRRKDRRKYGFKFPKE